MTYPIIELDDRTPAQLEQLGNKAKYWYYDADNRRILFKAGRPGTGENWAEKVCCEICRLLGLPHAEYELGVFKGMKGVISPNFVPEGARLIFGNELLSKIIDDYDQEKNYHARQHTLRTVMVIMSSGAIQLPIGWDAPPAIEDAAGVFVGYLLLDALVSNQDRHHLNWGVIAVPGQALYLAPTFDHASSLGRNESDKVRMEILNTRDKGRGIETYVARARSAFYEAAPSAKSLKCQDALREGIKIRPQQAEYWSKRLQAVDLGQFRGILQNVPDSEISTPARDFAYKMIETNMRNILSMFDELGLS